MGVALVLGGAACLHDDVTAALSLGEYAGVVTCNDATVFWPGPIAGAASYHAEKWPVWIERRRRLGRKPPARLFGHQGFTRAQLRADLPVEFVPPTFPGQIRTGSSGLFALKAALIDLGFDKAVVCGMPLDDRGHVHDQRAWTACLAHRPGWTEALPQIADRARSLSGWTEQLLGRPTAAWLTAQGAV
jgi:hypothetical protein